MQKIVDFPLVGWLESDFRQISPPESQHQIHLQVPQLLLKHEDFSWCSLPRNESDQLWLKGYSPQMINSPAVYESGVDITYMKLDFQKMCDIIIYNYTDIWIWYMTI